MESLNPEAIKQERKHIWNKKILMIYIGKHVLTYYLQWDNVTCKKPFKINIKTTQWINEQKIKVAHDEQMLRAKKKKNRKKTKDARTWYKFKKYKLM